MRLVVDGWIPNPEFLTELMPKKKKKKANADSLSTFP